MKNDLPIGVFDSGMGGLTVLRALLRRLPHEDMLYLGDTARLPYGTKSRATISRYSVQAASKLVEHNVKLLVIACNTATAAALDDLRAAWPDLPVIGVIEPGAKAACAATTKGHVAVIGTESTIRGQAYQRAIKTINPDARVEGKACSLFVPLAEEGWMSGPIVESVASEYLGALFPSGGKGDYPDCLLLGCTHFPPLAGSIAKVINGDVRIVDSAETTAQAVGEALDSLGLHNGKKEAGKARFLTTDDADRFARIGSMFLGRELLPEDVELVNL